jgi:hypothetical protein
MGLFDFIKHDRDAPGAEVDEATRFELRRVANLFLLSSVTLIVLLLEVFARALEVSFIPQPVYAVGGLVFLVGWAATFVYGLFVTFRAGRWGWFVLCVIPLTCVPASVAYAWIRRGEIEREVLGDAGGAQGAAAAGRAASGQAGSRQRRGGRKKR